MANYDLDLDVGSMCRVCSLQKEKLYNLFSNCLVEGIILPLPAMIRSCLELEVNEYDTVLPRQICDHCKIQVINFYTFKDKSKRAEEALERILRKPVSIVKNEDGIETASPTEINVEGLNEFEDDLDHQNEEEIDYESELLDQKIENDNEILESNNTTVLKIHNILQNTESENIINALDKEMENYTEKHIEIPTFPRDLSEVNVCGICGRSFDTSNNLDRHMDTHIGVYYKCRICPRVYNHQASRNRHMRETHPEEMYQLVTKYNQTPFAKDDPENPPKNLHNLKCQNEYLLESLEDDEILPVKEENVSQVLSTLVNDEHLTLNTNETILGDTEVDIYSEKVTQSPLPDNSSAVGINSSNNFLKCPYCRKTFKRKNKLVMHMNNHENNSIVSKYLNYFTCKKCFIMFPTEDQCNNHYLDNHPNENELFVDDQYTDYQFLEEDRMSVVTDDTTYKCGICGENEPSEFDMKRHIMSHADRVSCPFKDCGSEYTCFTRLNNHIVNRHLEDREFKCVHCCEVSYETLEELQSHMRKECKERKFDCYHCDKKFLTKLSLQNHQKTFKEKKFMCQFCGKSFAQAGELTIHNRSHTNERPFQCTICNKSYKTSSMRASHMDSHIEGKTFTCDICGKKLQTRTCYRNHMKRHTVEKRYECTLCSKKFHTKYHLTLHTSRIHLKNSTNKTAGKIV